MPNIDPILYRTPVVDPETGLVSQQWNRYFQDLNRRLTLIEDALAAGIDTTITVASTTSIVVIDGIVTSVI